MRRFFGWLVIGIVGLALIGCRSTPDETVVVVGTVAEVRTTFTTSFPGNGDNAAIAGDLKGCRLIVRVPDETRVAFTYTWSHEAAACSLWRVGDRITLKKISGLYARDNDYGESLP